jgi:tetratricopeptide (TPR) repeat protein
MDRPPPRTLLEQLVRRSSQTIEEACAEFDQTAKAHGERVSLSPRQLSRWLAGRTGLARPAAQRVALLQWGYDFERLVGRPVTPAPRQSERAEIQSSEPSPVDWPMWFGTQLAAVMAVVDSFTDPTVMADDLQTRLNKEVTVFDTGMHNTDAAYLISRRQALISVAAFPFASAASGLASPEVFLSRCAASLAACWHLLGGSDLHAVAHAISLYLPDLEIVAGRASAHRDLATRLAVQAHRISGIVALHRGRLALREHHCQQAVRHASSTSDRSGQASALISLASTHFYADDPVRAAAAYERALSLESALPALQRSRIHAELAVAYGQLGRVKESLSSIERAERLYPSHPEQDPSFLYAEFTQASLVLELGLAFLALAEQCPRQGFQRTAANVFGRIENPATTAAGPERIRCEILNHQARASVLGGDLEATESHLQRAVDASFQLDSKQRQREARAAWNRAVARWPREKRLAAIGNRMREL